MLTVHIPNGKMRALRDAVEKAGRKLPNEVAIALNKAAKATQREISKGVREELAVSAGAVNKTLSQTRRATKAQLGATVRLAKTSRLPLRDFGARQKRAGVSYKISKKQGRKLRAGAFQGPKPGVIKASWKGHVFQRQGKERLPIQKLHGPSPWGVFVKRKMRRATLRAAQAALEKELDRRIQYLLKKASGAI